MDRRLFLLASLLIVSGIGCGPPTQTNDTGPSPVNTDTSTDTGTTEDTGMGTGPDAGLVEHSGSLDSDATWSGRHRIDGGYEITGSLTLEKCTTVELTPGTTIKLQDGGSIDANGTADCPIVFTSSQSSPSAGDWNRFDIFQSSSNAQFEHTVFEYGGGDADYGMLWLEAGARVSLSSATFRHSGGRAAYFESDANIEAFTGVKFEEIAENVLRIGPNEVGSLESIETTGEVPPIEIVDGTVGDEQTWTNSDLPFRVPNGFDVQAKLSVPAGTTLQLGSDARVSVEDGGSLHFNGTAAAPIRVTSSKSSPAAGDWKRIDIFESATNAEFTHTILEYGGSRASYGMLFLEQGARASLSNITFRNSGGRAAYFDTGAELDTFEGIKLEAIAESSFRIGPDEVGSLTPVETTGEVPPIEVVDGRVENDQTWPNTTLPYTIPSGFEVAAELRVAAGTMMRMGSGIQVKVEDGGAIRLLGESDNKVTIRSAKGSPAPGDWRRFDIFDSADNNNLFRHATIKHAGADPQYGATYVASGATLNLENTTYSDNDGCDVDANGTVNATGSDYTTCD